MTIIITGASSGIGKAVSLALIPYKPKLVIVARRSDKLRETAEELDKANIDFLPIIGDVRNAEDRNKIIDLTLQEFGQIDVLINNAGIGKANLIVEQPEEEIDELLETNVKALIMLTRKNHPYHEKGRRRTHYQYFFILCFASSLPFCCLFRNKSSSENL